MKTTKKTTIRERLFSLRFTNKLSRYIFSMAIGIIALSITRLMIGSEFLQGFITSGVFLFVFNEIDDK